VVGIKRRMDVAKERTGAVKFREVKPGLYHKRQSTPFTNLRLTAYNYLSQKAGMSSTNLRGKY